MRALLVGGSAALALLLAAIGALVMDISFGHALLLAPVFVLTVGAAVGLLVLWTRVALDPVIRRRRAQREEFESN